MASKNEFTFACYLIQKLDIQVLWDPFNKNTIASVPSSTPEKKCCFMNNRITISLDGQAINPGRPPLRECIARTYGSAIWLSQLPGFSASRRTDSSSGSDSAGLDRDNEASHGGADGINSDEDAPYRKNCYNPGHSSIAGIGLTTTYEGNGRHTITNIVPGVSADRSRMFAIGDLVTGINLRATENITTEEINRLMIGPSRPRIYKLLEDTQGRPSTARLRRGDPTPRTVSWSKATLPLRTRRHMLSHTTDQLNEAEIKELESLKKGETAYIRAFPKLTALGYATFDTIPRIMLSNSNIKFWCPWTKTIWNIDTESITKWLHTLSQDTVHITSLKITRARPATTQPIAEHKTIRTTGIETNIKEILVLANMIFSNPVMRVISETLQSLVHHGNSLHQSWLQDGSPLQDSKVTHIRQSSLVRAMDMTKNALYHIENMDQSKDLIDLTCNPQETASAANL